MEILRISKQEKQWKLHVKDSHSGEIYTLRRGALKAAGDRIKNSPAGQYSQVQIQRQDSSYETIWTLEEGPFPPELHKRIKK